MAWTTPSTQPTGTIITSSMFNAHLVNNIKFLHGPPTARLARPASQTVSVSVWTAIAWSSKVWDTNAMFATTGTKVTCKTAGKFQVNFQAVFKGSTKGSIFMGAGIRKNSTGTGGPTDGYISIPPLNTVNRNPGGVVGSLISLTTGQFFETIIFSDGSSNNLKTSTSAGQQPLLSVLWVSS